MTLPPTPMTTTIPHDPDRPHRPTDDGEHVYFDGSPLLRADLTPLLAWGLAGLLVLAAVVFNLAVWHARVPGWAYAVAIVVAVACLLVPVLLRRTVRYRITNYRVDVTRGLISRNIDTLELWHVEDMRLHQGPLARLFNCGTITVMSHDDTTPKLDLVGLPAPQELFRALQQRVIAVKRQRGVMKVDVG